jgi:Fur family ferric uptake transcriptional regulator
MKPAAGRAPAAPAREERQVLSDYLVSKGLKRSAQREVILEAFLNAGRHVSVEDLLRMVKRRDPQVGRTTIYRTLKLFQEAGLASELLLGGEARFEPLWKREHHDHFFCVGCGEIFEFQSPEIEKLQEEIARGLGFVIEGHRHNIFGRCRKCAAKAPRETRKHQASGASRPPAASSARGE